MSGKIDHALLDRYEQFGGELERLPLELRPDPATWEVIDELLLDLHLIRHGYASEGYEKHIEKRLKELCANASVAERIKAMR